MQTHTVGSTYGICVWAPASPSPPPVIPPLRAVDNPCNQAQGTSRPLTSQDPTSEDFAASNQTSSYVAAVAVVLGEARGALMGRVCSALVTLAALTLPVGR
jgi:hypothetical protein